MKYFTREQLDYIYGELLKNPRRETLKKLNDKYNAEETIEKETNSINWVESPKIDQPKEMPQVAEPLVQQPAINLEPVAPTLETQPTSQPMEMPQAAETLVQQPAINIEPVAPTLETQPTSQPMEMPQAAESSTQEQVVNAISIEENNNENIPSWTPTNNFETTVFGQNINNSLNVESSNINNNIAPPKVSMVDELNSNFNINTKETVNSNAAIENNYFQDNTNLNNPSLDLPKVDAQSMSHQEIPFNGNLWEPQSMNVNNLMQTTDNFTNPIEQETNTQNSINNNFFNNTLPTQNNPIPIMTTPTVEGPTMFGQIERNFNNNAA